LGLLVLRQNRPDLARDGSYFWRGVYFGCTTLEQRPEDTAQGMLAGGDLAGYWATAPIASRAQLGASHGALGQL
jgi:hypothetical protein